jgi:hypothetical protein
MIVQQNVYTRQGVARGWDAWQTLKEGTNYEINRWP